jgi:hypothetical protein
VANNGRNNRRRRSQRKSPSRHKGPSISQEAVKLTCVRCQEPIRNPETALSTPDTGEPVHFDCAIREVADREQLGIKEKICYLGQGTFGIINYAQGGAEKGFVIKKRIPYETADKVVEWRKTIRNSVLELK